MNKDYIVFYDKKYQITEELVNDIAQLLLEPKPDKNYRGIECLDINFSAAKGEMAKLYGSDCNITKEMFHKIIYDETCNCIKNALRKYSIEADGTNNYYVKYKNHGSNIIDNLFFNSIFDISFEMTYMLDINLGEIKLIIGNHDDVNTIWFVIGMKNFIDKLNKKL